jgi:hypothetical protein
VSDPVIERLEAELRESQFAVWDVETLIADRHRAKIEALTADDKWARRRQVAQELATVALALIGYLTVVAVSGAWLLTGEFPL